jgi:proteasome lid subunit RPN8/RPN11
MELLGERMTMINTVFVPEHIVSETLAELQNVGRRQSECVVLWLGVRDGGGIRVKSLWKPVQEADLDYFRIPESSMDQLMQELRTKRLMIAAQVHTHPNRAFHSEADDNWAIVRHAGALSLVVPYFALRTDKNTFKMQTAVFSLSPQNEWQEAPKNRIDDFYKIIP